MVTAAVALRRGWGDPLQFLALARDDFDIAAAIVREADDQQLEHERRLAEYAAGYAANRVVEGVSQIARGVVRALRRGR